MRPRDSSKASRWMTPQAVALRVWLTLMESSSVVSRTLLLHLAKPVAAAVGRALFQLVQSALACYPKIELAPVPPPLLLASECGHDAVAPARASAQKSRGRAGTLVRLTPIAPRSGGSSGILCVRGASSDLSTSLPTVGPSSCLGARRRGACRLPIASAGMSVRPV